MTDARKSIQKIRIGDVEYADVFAVIKAISDERDLMLDWLDEEVLAGLATLNRPVRILSVGAGPGDFDARLIERLRRRTPAEIEYVAVEPSTVFTNQVSQLADPRLRCEVLRSFFEDAPLAGEFDFILCFHSLYYVTDRAGAIMKALDALTPGHGRLVLMHQSWSGVAQIQRHFVPKFNLPLNPGPPSELMLDLIDGLRAKYRFESSYSLVWTKLETTQVLDPASAVAPALFHFLLNALAEDVGPDALNEFRDFVAELSYPHAGKMWMQQPLGVFVLSQPNALRS